MYRKRFLSAFSLALLLTLSYSPLTLAEESITISTYYPSPYGVYREMRAKRIAIGDTYFDGAEVPWEAEDGDGNPIDLNADLVVEGNVGIGTTSPTGPLDVYGTGAAKGLTVDTSGNVGIGTTSPSTGFEVRRGSTGLPATSGTSQAGGILRLRNTDGSAYNWVIDFGITNISGAGGGWIQTTHVLGLENIGSLLLNPNGGNVGIGTTSPTAKLHVGGVSGTDGIRFPDGTLQTTAGSFYSGMVIWFSGANCPTGWTQLGSVADHLYIPYSVDQSGTRYIYAGYTVHNLCKKN
ncbi:MAG: hypothetical protein PHO03_02975 [Candidatus Omnitrophica bacterium]|nr:hypothetical protein [Candidatus Omnitrophota bacterium]